MDIKQNSDGSLFKSSAETLLHFFWIAFNNFNMYGADHPIAKKGAENFYFYLNKAFNIISPIDFHMEGESFMCNKCITDDKIKIQRLTDRFRFAGIHSISLDKEIAINDLIELFILLNDSKNYKTVQKIVESIKEKGIKGIHLNYFTYKKVAGDNETETLSPDKLIMRIIKQEFQKGDFSVKHLGQIIKKASPDLTDLKNLLPQIREVFISKGLTLNKYINFLKELSTELGEKGIIGLSERTDGKIGISLNEISEEYKKNPQKTTELLILATKLASLNGIDQNQFIPILIKDIEIAIKKIALNYIHNNQVSNVEELKNIFSHIKKNLITELDKYGMKPDIILEINNQLSDRSNTILSNLTAEWIISAVSYKKDFSNEQLIKALTDLIKNNKHMKGYIEPLISVLQEKGISIKLLEEFTENFQTIDLKKETIITEAKINKKSSIKKLFKFPTEILKAKETKKYLQNEIYRNLRYNTPLSCISLSVAWINTNSILREPDIEELDKTFSAVTEILIPSLRLLDTIGSLGSLKYNHLLIILQMTDKAGTLILKERLRKQFNNIKFELNGNVVIPIIVLSSVTFNKEKTPDINSFLRAMRKNLKNQKKLIIKV